MSSNIDLINILKEFTKAYGGQYLFRYPQNVLTDGYLHTFRERHCKYIEIINALVDNDWSKALKSELPNIQKIATSIETIVGNYLSGNNAKAHEQFDAMMEEQHKHLASLSYQYQLNESFYRVRTSDKEINDRKEMFHIPYHKRHLVATQRYSIAGVPCLYLGNTIYACWQELNKPDLNKMYISKFVLANTLEILDFAITFETLQKQPTMYEEKKILAFFSLYPLIMACSFKKKYEDATFNIEYIIPNMILQWLSREKDRYSGIRYFSTKMKHDSFDSIGINLVVPPREMKDSVEEGYCPALKSTFKYTHPVSWALINTFPDGKKQYKSAPDSLQENQRVLQNVDDFVLSNYKITRFAKVEENIKFYFQPLFMDDNGPFFQANPFEGWE